MSITAALITGAASLAGGAMGNRSSAAQAQKNRDFQAEMSNTSYQRAVEDMKKAGINPMLAAKTGGASTPSGSTASQSDIVTPAVNSALAAKQMSAGVEKVDAETRVANATAEGIEQKNAAFDRFMANLEADTDVKGTSAQMNRDQSRQIQSNIDATIQNIEESKQRVGESGARVEKIRQDIKESEERILNLGLSRHQTAVEIQRMHAQIANLLTEGEAAALELGYERKYGDMYRRGRNANTWSDATRKQAEMPKAQAEGRFYEGLQGDVTTHLREWVRSLLPFGGR